VKRSGGGEACRRGGQRVTGSEGVVDEEQGGPMELLEVIAWPKEVEAVDGQRALTEDVGVGEKLSPGVVSRRFELDGAAAPSADEEGAVH
jgi:hypothetical protein